MKPNIPLFDLPESGFGVIFFRKLAMKKKNTANVKKGEKIMVTSPFEFHVKHDAKGLSND